ncbi:DUF1571 domain-containing protein [Reichenbachiella sp.]|uniref:LysM peptidoglycan-binding domain-containing protein n=1 Tax=Reichenbachiella sp. TaxID=2184521 RepID=UPI003BAEBD64
MTRTGYCSLFLLFVNFFASAQLADSLSGYEIAKKMFDTSSQIESLTYTITKQERIDGKLTKQVSFTKMQKSPYKVYLRQSFPNDGMEVLYVKNENNDKALINPNGFPWLNLKLNPMDGIMRNDQHHTIFQSGFDHVVSILEFLCAKYLNEIDEMVVYKGMVDQQERRGYKISFDNPYFEIIDYVIGDEETIEDVAEKYKLSAYMILECNPKIKDYEDVEAGQVIKIPNDYSPKLNLVIDAENFIPLKMEVIDGNGLYEQYEYSNVMINPTFTDQDFLSENESYGF